MILKDKKYHPYSYENKEEELEKVVLERAQDLFGEYRFLFPKKKLESVRAELSTIPDGFVLDLSDVDSPILYTLEVEIKSHGLEHIATQILKFAISYGESRPALNRFLKEIIRADEEIEKKIENRLKESKKFKHLDQLIDEVMDEEVPNVVVPIDGLDESLNRVQNYIRIPIRYLPIETFINPEKTEMIHYFTPLYQVEEAAKPSEVGTFYKFMIDNVELIDIPRLKFDEENHISKHVQGYTFIRDKDGEPQAVLFWGYRSRVEEHIQNEVRGKESWAGTARPVDPSSYKIGMDVYLGETMWDGDKGGKVEDPKYRIKGKLKEILRVDRDKETQIFPILK